MQWYTQAGSISTNLKVKIDFTLPELSATKIVTCNFHLGERAEGRYDMILGRYVLTALVINLKLSDRIIEADDGPLKGLTAPIVDLGMCEIKDLNYREDYT